MFTLLALYSPFILSLVYPELVEGNGLSALTTGWLLDIIFGDPEKLPHPVVYMGKWIAKGEHRLNHGSHRKLKGAMFTVGSIALFFSLLYIFFDILLTDNDNYELLQTCKMQCIMDYALSSVCIFYCLAGKTLRKEVKMVFEAVDRSIEDGRKQVSRIVGRDTSELTPNEVRTAALETLAENLSDGVIAPLFWYCILGVPGMLTYKLINTFDSMIAYQTPRYKDFGCWAAHIDDIANYIPARITAILMIIFASLHHPTVNCFESCRSIFHFPFSIFHFVWNNARRHASPNSGWPESALAGILDCRFGGPHNYFGEYFYKPYIGTNPRPLTKNDMHISLRICLGTEILAVIFCTIYTVLV